MTRYEKIMSEMTIDKMAEMLLFVTNAPEGCGLCPATDSCCGHSRPIACDYVDGFKEYLEGEEDV